MEKIARIIRQQSQAPEMSAVVLSHEQSGATVLKADCWRLTVQ
jgi:hypothetical protein